MEILSPTTDNLREFDFCGRDGAAAITCEIKSIEGLYVADWWVTGPDSKKNLRVLARITLPLPMENKGNPPLTLIQAAYKSTVQPLVNMSLKIGGMAQTLNSPEVAIKKRLCEAHLDLHKMIGNIGRDDVDQKVNVALQYQLIKSIGFKSAVPMIATREGLKITTILRRIDTAKAQGLLPRAIQPPHLRD